MFQRKKMKTKFRLAAFLALTILSLPAKEAQAIGLASCGGCCNCLTIRNYIKAEIDRHEKWLVDTFWKKKLEPALNSMANQVNTGLVDQATQIGSFANAQGNIEKSQMIQEMNAETARNYVPSEQLCRFGSLGLSLAASEEKARANKIFMIERSLSRQLGQSNDAAAAGDQSDIRNRTKNMLTRYCDKADNGGENSKLCQTGSEDRFLNNDINFVGTIDSKPTLDIDFGNSGGNATDDEKDVLALADNIFASDLFSRPKTGDLKGDGAMNDARLAVMDMRALIAKRSVAENSFNTLIAMKSRGTGADSSGNALGSTPYVKNVLKELKINDAEIDNYLGKAPSYDAQMEVLTKKLYQSPSFYINLMDNPANVDRQYAAMQSFGLMQQRDIFDSIIRSEMLLSLIVELEVSKYQDDAQAMMDRN
ncbi:MAG: hypothetical protein DI586_00600 [Micavibrio aeruginosavorus]|uniref:Uncharacterized protein n=1 Tax=Micavibrio aeruginosavorus TaxID=349221 RepID=A0A2W5FS97_9BACT|nr:MAG: hypothetical protein DI586_00600 [Micavibrio aeruginosavorus]